jgi:uncharacterized phage-associated protein
MWSAHDVAAYILSKHHPISAMKLQKLVYYCQAWSLVWDDRPLFHEQIEAWANGPVVEDLYRVHRGQFNVDSWPVGDPGLLDQDATDTIDEVLKFYGSLNAQQLSDMTHSEGPWRSARGGLKDGERCNYPISLDSMMEYYSGLPYTEEVYA